jgi:glycosyltransferase involved in cell wall biosynthesis
MIKVSLCMCVWNTSHLLARSVYSYLNQTFNRDEFEIIIIDDNSMDNILLAIEPLNKLPNVRIVKLRHGYGMRGCTVAFNTAFKLAKGEVIAETTPETMLPPNALEIMYQVAMEGRNFCAMKTYNLTPELQLKIDEVDWKSDIDSVKKLDGFNNPWTMNNIGNKHFGTHQTCAIKKELFFEIFPDGFPLYGDYGSEDPHYCGIREQKEVKDVTIMEPIMAIHQWHAPFQFWMSKGLAPMLNKNAHSMSNYLKDKSGQVPDGGTCQIWDSGSHEQLSKDQIVEYAKMDDIVRKTGCKVIW